jgi:UDP-3-O-[3-hydroxymyristoyl] N-acetylglucosamine deacetylase / 3-hydroxyacyl-[acyl-carrier-protein] dehydratase
MQTKNKLISTSIFEGIGLHSGSKCKMSIAPGSTNEGIKFVRTDLDGLPVIIADTNHVTATQRGTTLTANGASVATIEHLMSALASLGVYDAEIHIDGPEVPILDGSAQPYIDQLSGLLAVDDEHGHEPYVVTETMEFVDDASGSSYTIIPSSKYEISASLDFGNDVLDNMLAKMNDISEYKDQIAPNRTFVFLSEIEKLFDAGLIKGGDLDNAVVIVDASFDESDVERLRVKLNKPQMKISTQGIVNPSGLKFKNEPARHKILDLIGDLALIGRPIQGKIIANKPGHTGNVALAKFLKGKYNDKKRSAGRPTYNPNAVPVMTIEDIKSYLPHRYPFLLVDKVMELSATHIVGIKNVTGNEAFFEGHFPGNPIFPGVLQMEALAQTGGILALSTVEDRGSWDTYFLKMDNVKFKAKVTPGDTLILKMELLSPIRRGIVQMAAHAYVGDKLVSEAELTAQIVKRSGE